MLTMEVDQDTWCSPEKVYPDRNQNHRLGETPPCRWISALQRSRRERNHLELQNKEFILALLPLHGGFSVTLYHSAINQKTNPFWGRGIVDLLEQSGFTGYFYFFKSKWTPSVDELWCFRLWHRDCAFSAALQGRWKFQSFSCPSKAEKECGFYQVQLQMFVGLLKFPGAASMESLSFLGGV